MKRLLFYFLMAAALFAGGSSFAQVAKGNHLLIPGIGFDHFKIDSTTMEDIVKVYGKPSKTDTFYNGKGAEHY